MTFCSLVTTRHNGVDVLLDLTRFAAVFLVVFLQAVAFASTWDCEVLMSEQKVEIDDQSGARITFARTHPATDTNIYTHHRCFLWGRISALVYSEKLWIESAHCCAHNGSNP